MLIVVMTIHLINNNMPNRKSQEEIKNRMCKYFGSELLGFKDLQEYMDVNMVLT